MRNKGRLQLLLFCFELAACVLAGQVAAQPVEVPESPNLHLSLDLCTTARKNATSSVECVFYTMTFDDSGCDTPAPVNDTPVSEINAAFQKFNVKIISTCTEFIYVKTSQAFRVTLWSSDPESIAAVTAKYGTNGTLVSCASWSLPFTPQRCVYTIIRPTLTGTL